MAGTSLASDHHAAGSSLSALRPPALAVRRLQFSYERSTPTLRGVDLEVQPGAVCMVLGPSGSGKTTLLKAVKGLIRPQEGRIELFGDSARQGLRRAREVAYIPQHLGLVQSMTALENTLVGALARVGTARSLLKAFPRPVVEEAYSILDALGLHDKADKRIYALSGGERQRAAVARALLQRARLVLADELISQLDPVRAEEIFEQIRRIAHGGTTFLVTCHEVDLVARYGDQAVFLREGAVAHDGPAADVSLDLAERLLR